LPVVDTSIYVRAPDHLGDGVMALPAIALLAGHGRVRVAAPGWGPELYGHLGVEVHPRQDAPRLARASAVAVLLKPSLSAAWQARGAARRVGLPTDRRRLLLTDVVEERGEDQAEHRADSMLRVAATALGVDPALPALPALPTPPSTADVPTDIPDAFVLLLPGTASAATVQWRGFTDLAAALGPAAVATGGPGDDQVLRATGARVVAAPRLSQLAALACAARAVVGNDSGLPHLAAAARRAAGRSVTDVHVVYASTDAMRTGPPGSTAWAGPRPDCWPCYAKRCSIGAPCRDAAVGPLLDALGRRT